MILESKLKCRLNPIFTIISRNISIVKLTIKGKWFIIYISIIFPKGKTEMDERIIKLRRELHGIPEPSGLETKTKEKLKAFLKENTSLELIECGRGFYAAHRENDKSKKSLAFRADFDALPLKDGGYSHLCGHDGHSAALCAVALELEGKTFGRDIFLLFQPAEENGEGAKECLELLMREKPGEIYGAHNLPGFEFGKVFTRAGTFACASRGLTLRFEGKPAHAAYPELGISPAKAVGEILEYASEPLNGDGMLLCTVIGVDMGTRSFGTSASNAEIRLTLRGEYDRELNIIYDKIIAFASNSAEKHGLSFTYEDCDVFPSTENDPGSAATVMRYCDGEELTVPMRWSEDFGWYLKYCRGAFFGIGAGIEHSPLHSESYEYPDSLLEPTANAFMKLVREENNNNNDGFEIISQIKAKELMDAGSCIVVDTRTRMEYKKGHIPGAILIPDYDLTNEAEEKLPDLDALILIYCRSGRRSKLAAAELVELGYTNVKEFGGIDEWKYDIVI